MSLILPFGVKVGDEVGAARWPFMSGHPDGWGEPHKGILLAINDPRAWEGSGALGNAPSQRAVDAHVDWCKEIGLLRRTVPVLWTFVVGGTTTTRVFWESTDQVVPYRLDLGRWKNARAETEVRLITLSRAS